MFSEDSLSANPKWLSYARTIYEEEKGEPYTKSNNKLAEWLKNRQSEVGWDLTSMGAAALRADKLPSNVKQAWINSMEMYDDMKTEGKTVRRNMKNMAQDPTFSLPLLSGIGAGISGGRFLGGKAASIAGRFAFKKQLQRALQKQKVSKVGVKEFIGEGISTAVKPKVLEQARKEAAKSASRWQGTAGGLWSGTAAGLENIVTQKYDRIDEDVDYGKVAKEALTWGIGGAALTGLPVRAWTKFRNKKVLNEYQKNFDKAIKREGVIKSPKQARTINIGMEKADIEDILDDAELHTADGGTLEITLIGGSPTKLAEKIKLKKINEAGGPKKVDTQAQKKMASEADFEAKKTILDTEETVRNYTDNLGFDLSGKTRSTKKGLVLVGQKVRTKTEPIKRKGDGRKLYEKILGPVKRVFGAGVPWSVTSLQAARRGGIDRAARGVATKMGLLEEALEKQFNVKDMKELNEVDRTILTDATDILTGQEAKREFSSEVLTILESMKKEKEALQKDLFRIDPAIVDENTPLGLKIKASIDGTLEGWWNKQYEIHDNPAWTHYIKNHPEGKEIAEKAEQYIKNRFMELDEAKGLGDFRLIDNIVSAKLHKGMELDNILEEMPEESREWWLNIMGENGYVNQTVDDILASGDIDELGAIFDKPVQLKKGAGKIFKSRQDIDKEIRALMGEYKDPFTNYRNSVMKLNQIIQLHKYENSVANLIRKGQIAGTSRQPIAEENILTELKTSLPEGARSPFLDVQEMKGMKIGFLDEALEKRRSPLDKLYANPQVADAIINGNEITRTIPSWYQGYLLLQGHTRAAKTVWSPTAIARNFLGAGWMAIGAGYINPASLGAGWRIAKGLAGYPDAQLRAEVEKGIALGYLQSGIELQTIREVLRLAGKPDSLLSLQSGIFREKDKLKEKASSLNIKATKFYQAGDDVWKQFAFENEKGMYRKVMLDEGMDPDEVIDSFISGDGIPVKITALDKLAGDNVLKHMQNYGGVPQFVRYARLAPAADFLAFTTELIRTQSHIIRTSFNDMKTGMQLLRESGGQRGRARFNVGLRRAGSFIAAQSAAPALAYTSSTMIGMDEKEPGEKYTKREGLEYFNAPFDKGAQFFYSDPPVNGEGKRVNMSYVNPWARLADPIQAGFDALNRGEDVDGKVMSSIKEVWWEPLKEVFGPSMMFEAIVDLYRNRDEYGRPINTEAMTREQKTLSQVLTFLEPFEPGFMKDARDLYTATARKPEGKEYGVTRGKNLRKMELSDEMWGMTGVKPQHYDIKISLRYKLADLKADMGDARNIFNDMIREQSPMNAQELLRGYTQSLKKQYSLSKEMFDVVDHARSTGMSDRDIINVLERDGKFRNPLDKRMLKAMFRGRFEPPRPTSKNIKNWIRETKKQGGSPPPLQEAMHDLMNIYRSFKGEKTGTR